MFQKFREECKKLVEKTYGQDLPLETPPQGIDADLALPCFVIAKRENKPPQVVAKELVMKMRGEIPGMVLVKKVEASGPYVNFYVDNERFSKFVVEEILKEKHGYGKGGNKGKILIEFSQPNPCKAMHIGHARTTFLGDSLSNIMEFDGWDVTRANYYNDVGKQVAKAAYAYSLWGKDGPDKKPDHWLADLYVKLHKEIEKKPEIDDEINKWIYKFEVEKDKELEKLWNKVTSLAIEGFKETYKRLNVRFDVDFIESDFRDRGREMVEELIKKGIAEKTLEGTVVAKLEKYGIPNCVILRSDGTSVYYVSDFALTEHKFENYKLDKAVWVVAEDQNLYFQQLFKLLELLGYDWAKNCIHMSFSMVTLRGGRMSSRKGTFITIDEVLDELKSTVKQTIEEKNPKLKNKDGVAEKVAIAAFKFTILKTEPNKTVDFNMDVVTKFEGATGPYLQYTYARAKSILRKSKKRPKAGTVDAPELVKNLSIFPEIVESASKDLKPHYIANYLLDLASLFNEFYHSQQVIGSEKEEVLLALVEAVSIVLKNGLKLLGIEAVEEM
jgi:arginyl-tRNA synthetase